MEESKKKKLLSRRSFVGGSALAAVGATLASAGALTGCSSEPKSGGSGGSDSSSTDAGSVAPGSAINPQDESYTTYTTDYSALFEPIQAGPLKLKNRLIKSSAGSDTSNVESAIVDQNAIDYYTNMAKGGIAMIMVETGTIRHLGFDPSVSPERLRVDNPEDGIEPAKALTDSIHEHDCYVGYQLSGPGNLGQPPVVNDISTEDIKAYVQDMAAAAQRLQRAGFDCLEIKGATTDGLNAFLSRRENMREDEYGPQSMENRIRFFAEMVSAVKEACGDDFAVAVLINGMEENDEMLGANDKFITIEESTEFAQLLEAAGADIIQIRVASPGQEITCWAPDCNHAAYRVNGMTGFGNLFDYDVHWNGMIDGNHSGAGSFIPACSHIKQAVSVPVGCAGSMDPRLAPDMINDAVANGDIDLVFLNRPITVDPEMPNKLQAGKREEVAPCTRCLHCHARPLGFPDETCRVNASTQHAYMDSMPEGYDPLPADTAKKVMVVGGGPAGMEAARIAAERGHEVSLYEKDASLGGLMKTASAFKGEHERLQDLIDYLSLQQELKGVEVHTDTEVTPELVDEVSPDAVVVAVGGDRETKLSAAGSTNVVGLGDFQLGEIGDNVVIVGAGAQAIDTAFYLLAEGKKITMVHSGAADEVDKEQSIWFQHILLPHLYAQGVRIFSEAEVTEVTDEGLVITTDMGYEKVVACDTVLECYDMIVNDSLAQELEGKYEVHAVGDCSEPWNIQKAIFSGNVAARAI